MLTIFITTGITGSGKSFWAKNVVSDDKYTVRFNRDDVRAMINGGDPWKHFKDNDSYTVESMVNVMRDAFIKKSLYMGRNIIVDDTNHNSRTFKDVCKLVENLNISVEVKEVVFYIDLQTALDRDRHRTPSVGDDIVIKFFNKFGGENFKNYKAKARVFFKRDDLPVKHDGPKAIICDLDGTLCLYGDKNPYSRDFENDILNSPVADVLYSLQIDEECPMIIFTSGRSEKYRAQTIDFLTKHFFYPGDYILFMRADGDMRNDGLVKYEMYRDNIYGKYNILFVLDDRNRVVDMWRSVGLTCFQVAEGDF